MPTVQWQEIPYALETPYGAGAAGLPFGAFLPIVNPVTGFNSLTGPQWILQPGGCLMGAGKRLARDNRPQLPGEIVHRKYRTGLVTQLSLLAVNATSAPGPSGPEAQIPAQVPPACDEDLVDLFDTLMAHLHSIENADGRLTWLPSGKQARMVLAARWLGADAGGGGVTGVQTTVEDQIYTTAQIALLSPFPYAMDAAEIVTCMGGATPHCSGSPDTVTVTNQGTSEFWPVFRVYGPTSGFEIQRTSALTGLTESLTYTTAYPGAPAVPSGRFVEFDFFRETAYIDGNQANAKAGIDVLNSDFWALEVGANEITIFGSTAADMHWQSAYTG